MNRISPPKSLPTRQIAPYSAGLRTRLFACGFAACLLQGFLFAGDQAAVQSDAKQPVPLLTEALQKPAWLAECSLSVREGYDSNVFLDGVSQRYLPDDLRSTKNLGSWVTTISPKLGVDLAAFLPDRKTLKVFSLIYAPDIGIYHNVPSESYTAHRFITLAKATVEDVTLNLENSFSYVRGDKDAPAYPGGYLNAFAQAPPRERSDQFQDHMNFSLQYDQERYFLRPVVSFLYYDMKTNLKNPDLATTPSGYINFPDRYDINGGMDFGYKLTSDFAVTLGYRYGHQYQQQFSWSPDSATNDYQRLLIGMEGRPFKWLQIQFQLGPDFRIYEPDTATHISPVGDHHPTVFYGEANVAASITRNDLVSFKFKQFQWVSACGYVPYVDTFYDLGYSRKITDQLSLNLGARLGEADYTTAYTAPGKRDDWMVTLSGGLRYTFNAHWSADLSYEYDRGLNGYGELAESQVPDNKRQFVRNLVSAGVQWKY